MSQLSIRPLDSLESFYLVTSKIGAPLKQEHLALKFGVRIEHNLPDILSTLKRAWIATRYQHPKIAAQAEDGKVVYKACTVKSVLVWAEETLIVKPGISSTELFSQLSAPAPQMLLYYLPNSSEIVFLTSHWRVDGMGALLFLDDFLAQLANPDAEEVVWGKEISNLPPGLDEAISLPDTVSKTVDAAQNQTLMDFGAHLPSINILPEGSNLAPSTTTQREELVLPEQVSSDITSACKHQGIGPTSAMHAALVAATLAMQDPNSPAKSYASWSAFNLRQHLPAALRGTAYAVAGAHTGVPLTLTPSGSFLIDAQVLQKFYRTALAEEAVVKGRQLFHKKLTHQLSQPLPEGMPIPADPALNSIGVVDKYVKGSYGTNDRQINITNFWLGNTVCTLNIWIHLWSFRGRTTLSALHNRGVYDQATIQALLKKTVEILCKELGVSRT